MSFACYARFFLLAIILIGNDLALAGNSLQKKGMVHEGIRVRPHFGFATMDSKEMNRVKLPTFTPQIGASIGYQQRQGWGLDLNFAYTGGSSGLIYEDEFQDASTNIAQTKIGLTGFYRLHASRYFMFSPLVGVARNQFRMELSEGGYHNRASVITPSLIVGCGFVAPIQKIAFFEAQITMSLMQLDIPSYGIDEMGVQTVATVGGGLVL